MNDEATHRAERLDRFRGYLLLLARLHTSTRLQGKLDASDVVQQTLVQALSGLEGFRGTSDAEMAAWLRQILARHLANVARDQGRQKRDVRREHSLEAALDQSASRLGRSWRPTSRRRASRPSGTSRCCVWPTRWPPCRSPSARP